MINAIDKIDSPVNPALEKTLADAWIWARAKETLNNVNNMFENYQFGEAGRQVYEFLWNDFADWYLEASKRQLNEGGERAAGTALILADVLNIMLRLLHPFTPYVTEALYGYLKQAVETNLMLKEVGGIWTEHLIVAPGPKVWRARLGSGNGEGF